MNLTESRFFKNAICPSATSLLLYLSMEVTLNVATCIDQHLSSCDFCGAELQLLARYPGTAEELMAPTMPAGLRLLAESLLTRHEFSSGVLEEISYELAREGAHEEP